MIARVWMAWMLVGCAAAPLRSSYCEGKQGHAHSCAHAEDCMLIARSCCGHCGAPASGDVLAVPADAAIDRPSRCVGASCPRCHGEADPRLVATCTREGRCAVLDLSRSRLSACATDAQCEVVARDCCECGATSWVAVRASSADAYRGRVCASDQQCPECVAQPEGAARCVEGHCVMTPAAATSD